MKLFLLLSMFLVPACVLADEAGPKEVVQEIFAKASAPEVSSDSAKQAEVSGHVDFTALARAALGKEKVPPAEFTWFRDTLQEIIGRTVFPKAPEFLKGVKITYNSVDTKGSAATVKSTVQNKADLTDVDYKLALEQGKGWKVVDIAIGGQSWVESIRDQVKEVVKKKKWKGLKDSMNRRLNELKKEKA